MKSELIFCPTCESAELDERVNAVLQDQKLKTYEEAYELIDDDGEIKVCFDCQEWDDADDDAKGEGWDETKKQKHDVNTTTQKEN